MTQQSMSDERIDLGAEAESRTGEIAEELARQTKSVGEKAREKAIEAADRKKGGVSWELRHLADKLGEMEEGPEAPHELAPLVGYASRTARKAADALENRSAEQIVSLVRDEVRERPGIAITAMFALGFLGGRLLRR